MLRFFLTLPLRLLRLMAVAMVGGSLVMTIYMVNAGSFRTLDGVWTVGLVLAGIVVDAAVQRVLRWLGPSPTFGLVIR